MVAQLLGLRLHVLANSFRRRPLQVTILVIGVLYSIALAAVLVVGLGALADLGDTRLTGDVMTVGGALVVAGFFVIPLVFGTDDSMDPRAFSLYGIPSRTLAAGLFVTALVSIPVIVLTVVTIASVGVWSATTTSLFAAIPCLILIVATCALGTRLATSVAAYLLTTRRAREIAGIVGVLVLLALVPFVVFLTNVDWGADGRAVLASFSTVLGWTPLGAAWAAPAAAETDGVGAVVRVLIATATVAALWLLWRSLVATMLRGRERRILDDAHRSLGWFDRLRATPGGVIAARSATYWSRDPRYHLSLIVIPILPIVIIALLSIVHVPWNILALIPLPLIVLFLGWSLHNDLAFDGSAVWLHVAAGVSGISDRLGRTFPTLAVGLPVVLVGSILTAGAFGSWMAFPSILGANACILLSGVGTSSYTSARFPYPAPRPGDSPFTQPQSTGSLGGVVQALSFAVAALCTVPTGYLVWRGVSTSDPGWHLGAFVCGVLTGAIVLWAGIVFGGRVFDRSGPELVAFAARH